MRGAPKPYYHAPPPVTRIIPAYAGSTLLGLMDISATQDHPRVCGEHSFHGVS